MANNKRISSSLKDNNDTGFSSKTDISESRFVNKDGSFNLRKSGLGFVKRFSIFQTMLTIPRWKFGGVILVFYFVMNTGK